MKNKRDDEQWNDLEIYLFVVYCSWKWKCLCHWRHRQKKTRYKSNSKLTLFVDPNWANRTFDYHWLICSAGVEVTFTTTGKKNLFSEKSNKKTYINIIIGMPFICLITIIWYKKKQLNSFEPRARGEEVRESDIRGLGNQTVI